MTASAPAAWAERASATEPHWCIQTPGVRRRGLPQKVTTTSAPATAANQSRRANGSSRLTATGRPVSATRRGAIDGARPQPPSLRHSRRQLMAAQPTTHPSLDDRHFDSKALEQGHECSLDSKGSVVVASLPLYLGER